MQALNKAGMGQSVLSNLMHSVIVISLRFIYSPWRPPVGRTDRQGKNRNLKGLAGGGKWDSRPSKPGGQNWWGSRRIQLGLFDTEY